MGRYLLHQCWQRMVTEILWLHPEAMGLLFPFRHLTDQMKVRKGMLNMTWQNLQVFGKGGVFLPPI